MAFSNLSEWRKALQSLWAAFSLMGKVFLLIFSETGSRPSLQFSHAHVWTPMDPVDSDLNLWTYLAWPRTFLVIMDLPKHHLVLPDPGNSHQDDSDTESLTCIPGTLTLRKCPAAVVLSHFLCVPPQAVFPCFQGAGGSSLVFCFVKTSRPFPAEFLPTINSQPVSLQGVLPIWVQEFVHAEFHKVPVPHFSILSRSLCLHHLSSASAANLT